MFFAKIVAAAAALATSAFAQNGIVSTGPDIVYNSEHNASSIVGSWSSGSRNVTTGSGFANPAQMSFIYPSTAGVAYAFSDDGYYELSRYRFISNGSNPNCITGTLVWAHGNYTLLNNGSIVLTPFPDGFQQVQQGCDSGSNFIQLYNQTELFQSWRIFYDQNDGNKLHLFQFDGSPVAPLFQTSSTPNMLPTQLLRNTTQDDPSAGTTVLNQRRRRRSLWKRSGAGKRMGEVGFGAAVVAFGVGALAIVL